MTIYNECAVNRQTNSYNLQHNQASALASLLIILGWMESQYEDSELLCSYDEPLIFKYPEASISFLRKYLEETVKRNTGKHIHFLKCDPEWFRLIVAGKKFCELRKDDRNYELGDILVVNEHFRNNTEPYFTGSVFACRISWMIKNGESLKEGHSLLGLSKIHAVTTP